MIIGIILIACLASYRAEISPKGFSSSYISRDGIQPIKGIFILLVFLSHFSQYVKFTTPLDSSYALLRTFLGQLVVAPFLFYSGYGIAESAAKKGIAYIKAMPLHRLLRVWMEFACAVVLFLLVNLILGNTFDPRRIALTFLAWDGIGNSNWYVFAILNLYLFSFLSYLLFQKHPGLAALMVTVLTCCFILVMKRYRDGYWYNTALCYAAGMWYSVFREKIERIVCRNSWTYGISFAVLLTAFWFLQKNRSHLLCYLLMSVAFSLLIVFITMKITIGNPFLAYCGKHLFSLFILQRIPMLLLKPTPISTHLYLYGILCLILSFALSAAFDRYFPKLWGLLEKPKKAS